jgi:hypothetical protein
VQAPGRVVPWAVRGRGRMVGWPAVTGDREFGFSATWTACSRNSPEHFPAANLFVKLKDVRLLAPTAFHVPQARVGYPEF